MNEIKKVAVIGSGVMGSSIAAHIANSDTEVVLLDIVVDGEQDRSALSKKAIQKLLTTSPAPLVHSNKVIKIKAGNLDDHSDWLKEADWIIEVIIENVDIKKKLYNKLVNIKKEEAIVSSNTSTIMLKDLIEGLPLDFQRHFMITHFFNPPRYMKLFELVVSKETEISCINKISEFADKKLGKGIVSCNDSPGFIANRIGFYWINTALSEAFNYSLKVEEVDYAMSKPLGIPKTGLFGLIDLVGIDLIPLIAKSFIDSLPPEDLFVREYFQPEIMTDMIKEGYTGRKGKGGFYLQEKKENKKIMLSKDLVSGDYQKLTEVNYASAEVAKKSLRSFLECSDKLAQYTKTVLLKLLSYTVSLIPEASEDLISIDNAMMWGYNWKYGPFQLIDLLGDNDLKGIDWLIKELKNISLKVPPLLEKFKGKDLYKRENSNNYQLDTEGNYSLIFNQEGIWNINDKKTSDNKPVLKNDSASVWDIGDGILCLEYNSKMNSIDKNIMEIKSEVIEVISKSNAYNGLIIGNDSKDFSVGANISSFLSLINDKNWNEIENIVRKGQSSYMEIKYSSFPVVSASSGLAIGGGCEILLHSDAIVSHMETYTGLVETKIGVIPGWGGCKEMLIRCSLVDPEKQQETIFDIIRNIISGKVSSSAEEAKDMLILGNNDKIVMNRNRILDEAKKSCLELLTSYKVKNKKDFKLISISRSVFDDFIESYTISEKLSDYEKIILKYLIDILSVGFTESANIQEEYLLELEIKAFMELIKNEKTKERIEYTLKTGKILKN